MLAWAESLGGPHSHSPGYNGGKSYPLVTSRIVLATSRLFGRYRASEKILGKSCTGFRLDAGCRDLECVLLVAEH